MPATPPRSILIVGRGPSIYDFDWSQVDCPVMAVSSGIFGLPEHVHCDHFVTLDEPKFYMAQLMAHSEHSWGNDGRCRYWAFWADPTIVKHVVAKRIRTVENLPLAFSEIMLALDKWAKCTKAEPDYVRLMKDRFCEELGLGLLGTFGLQPGWGDYQNVRGWSVMNRCYPQWFGDGVLAVHRAFNSLLMAVQVATRLGFTELRFAGVDLNEEHYESLRIILRRWYGHGQRRGISFVNLSPASALSQFMPTPTLQEIAA